MCWMWCYTAPARWLAHLPGLPSCLSHQSNGCHALPPALAPPEMQGIYFVSRRVDQPASSAACTCSLRLASCSAPGWQGAWHVALPCPPATSFNAQLAPQPRLPRR